MMSYAVVDRIEEENFVVCEVELIELEKSDLIQEFDKEIKMMDVLMDDVLKSIGSVEANDVLVIEHDGENVIRILYKDDEEKHKRLG